MEILTQDRSIAQYKLILVILLLICAGLNYGYKSQFDMREKNILSSFLFFFVIYLFLKRTTIKKPMYDLENQLLVIRFRGPYLELILLIFAAIKGLLGLIFKFLYTRNTYIYKDTYSLWNVYFSAQSQAEKSWSHLSFSSILDLLFPFLIFYFSRKLSFTADERQGFLINQFVKRLIAPLKILIYSIAVMECIIDISSPTTVVYIFVVYLVLREQIKAIDQNRKAHSLHCLEIIKYTVIVYFVMRDLFKFMHRMSTLGNYGNTLLHHLLSNQVFRKFFLLICCQLYKFFKSFEKIVRGEASKYKNRIPKKRVSVRRERNTIASPGKISNRSLTTNMLSVSQMEQKMATSEISQDKNIELKEFSSFSNFKKFLNARKENDMESTFEESYFKNYFLENINQILNKAIFFTNNKTIRFKIKLVKKLFRKSDKSISIWIQKQKLLIVYKNSRYRRAVQFLSQIFGSVTSNLLFILKLMFYVMTYVICTFDWNGKNIASVFRIFDLAILVWCPISFSTSDFNNKILSKYTIIIVYPAFLFAVVFQRIVKITSRLYGFDYDYKLADEIETLHFLIFPLLVAFTLLQILVMNKEVGRTKIGKLVGQHRGNLLTQNTQKATLVDIIVKEVSILFIYFSRYICLALAIVASLVSINFMNTLLLGSSMVFFWTTQRDAKLWPLYTYFSIYNVICRYVSVLLPQRLILLNVEALHLIGITQKTDYFFRDQIFYYFLVCYFASLYNRNRDKLYGPRMSMRLKFLEKVKKK